MRSKKEKLSRYSASFCYQVPLAEEFNRTIANAEQQRPLPRAAQPALLPDDQRLLPATGQRQKGSLTSNREKRVQVQQRPDEAGPGFQAERPAGYVGCRRAYERGDGYLQELRTLQETVQSVSGRGLVPQAGTRIAERNQIRAGAASGKKEDGARWQNIREYFILNF